MREFLDVDPQAIREAIENPDQSHVDEMLSFAEQANQEYETGLYDQKAAPEKLTVLVVEPMKEPYVKEIDPRPSCAASGGGRRYCRLLSL